LSHAFLPRAGLFHSGDPARELSPSSPNLRTT
jgi:hypothetical protein